MALVIYSGTKKNDAYTVSNIGTGSVQAYLRPSKGSDKVVISGAVNKDNLKFAQGSELVFDEEGNSSKKPTKDLVISYTTGVGLYAKTDTIVLENYFKNVSGTSTSSSFKKIVINGEEYDIASLYVYTHAEPKGSKVNGTMFSDIINMSTYTNEKNKGLTINAGGGNDTITGSRYNDTIKAVSGDNTINGGSGDDKIYGGKGTDIINGGLGNDKLYGGKGADTFVFSGDFGTDTVYSANQMDKLVFTNDKSLRYDKQGNNLVIYEINDDLTESGNSVVVSNYFKQKEGKTVQLPDKNIVLNTSNGTYMNDIIVGTDKANKISSGAGTDIIDAGKGNDTITLNGAGDKTIKLAYGDGKDTIVIKSNDVNINLEYDCHDWDESNTVTDPSLCLKTEYYKNGNNLEVWRVYDDGSEEYSKDITTIKNYFNSKYDFNLTVNGEEIDSSEFANEVHGSKNKSTNFVSNVRYGENWFYGGNKKDTYTSSTSSDNFVDESKKSNDVYNITDLTSDTWIWDQGGYDTLNLTVAEGDQCNLYFKVELPKDTNWYGSPLNIVKWVDGVATFNPEYAEESICFCNNESLEALFGGVTIADFFGDGYIEKININGHSIEGMAINSEFDFMTWIEFVEMGVQSWLQYDMGGVYASSDEVIAKGTADEIAGLVAAYQNANHEFLYGPPVSEMASAI